MALNKTDILDIELKGGSVSRSFLNKQIGEGDISGDLFGVRVFENGESVNLTGVSCVGYFIKPDGTTVVINGSVNGNAAYVILPQSCYAATGNFQLSIKLSGGGITMTARIVDGTIVDTVIGSIVDPGSVIPDLASWTALVSSANTAATNIGKIHIENELIEGTRYKIKVYKDS